ncbi:MAG: SCO family protein [Pseudomonadota bacterium]
MRYYIFYIAIIFFIGSLFFFINHRKQNDKQFELISINNNFVNLKSSDSRYKILYFGFSRCPDICPRVLTKINAIMQKINLSQKILKGYFITLDIKRDTKVHIKDFLKNYKYFDGLIPKSKEQLNILKEKYGVYGEKMTYAEYFQNENLSYKKDYLINHTSVLYIIDAKGRVVNVFSSDLEEDRINKILIGLA